MEEIKKIDKTSSIFEILFRPKGNWSATEPHLTDMMRELVLKQNEVIERLNSISQSKYLSQKDCLIENNNQQSISDSEEKAKLFLMAKIGFDSVDDLESVNLDLEKKGVWQTFNVVDLLSEFHKFLKAEKIKVNKNPRTNEYIYVDQSNASIIGSFELNLFEKK